MIEQQIAALDVSLFGTIESETSPADRRSLLALHHAIASQRETFAYLEIGSHLGGSLQVMIADSRCARIVSIDPRPQVVRDDRPDQAWIDYTDNSTERMLALLAAVPGAALAKLETVEASTQDLAPGPFARPDMCFIDGEHTQDAALRDARFCRSVMQGAGVLAFHDFNVVERGIRDFVAETRVSKAYLLRDSVFVIEMGRPTILPAVRHQLTPLGAIMSRCPGWLVVHLLGVDILRRRFSV